MQDPVLRLQEAVDWELFRATLEAMVAIVPKGPGGQGPFDPLMMFKALVLCRLHNLSDEALERQMRKDLGFMSFLGLTLADRVSDEKNPLGTKRSEIACRRQPARQRRRALAIPPEDRSRGGLPPTLRAVQ